MTNNLALGIITTLLFALSMLLSGCAADDDARCQSYGATPGTDAYISCMATQHQTDMQALLR